MLIKLKTSSYTTTKPEGPHVLFYMTANVVWEQEHTHARKV